MEKDSQNKIINALWIGNRLSQVEMLTINSFLKNGHSFVLWAYEPLDNNLPEGVIIKDASEIIPKEQVFCYKNSNQFGHGKGSYAGFSDLFRYKLLYEHGGWWVDMDVTCLKPFNFDEPYVFRVHHDFPVVGNIMKCPKGSDLMKRCYEQGIASIDEHNKDWHLPIQILNDNISELGLSNYIKTISNHDKWNDVRKMLFKNVNIPESWSAIHWINEEWRRNNIDKNIFYKGSTIGKLYEDYIGSDSNVLKKLSFRNKLKLSFFGAASVQIKDRIIKC
jgi:hypothetical protein